MANLVLPYHFPPAGKAEAAWVEADFNAIINYFVNINPQTINSGLQNQLAFYAANGTTLSGLPLITASRALISNASGLPTASSVTSTELGFVSGVTSAIQTQLGSLTSQAYVTIGNTTALSAERALTGTANQVIITDNGANSNVVLSTPQNIDSSATPSFASLSLTATSNQLILGTTTTATISAPTPAGSSRVYTFPDQGADYSVVATAGAQTIGGAKTFTSPISVPNGTNTSPAIQFNDADTGLYSNTHGEVLVTGDGVLSARFSQAGVEVIVGDLTLDNQISGATARILFENSSSAMYKGADADFHASLFSGAGSVEWLNVNHTTSLATFKDVALSNQTASRAVVFDSNKKLVSSTTTATEIGYVNGVTSAIQTQIDGKEPTLTKGNLTDAGTDGITITGGTNAVIGSGTSISQHVADATHNGYLSSTDWNTFNTAASGGANTTLSNLTDTVAINKNLNNFSAGTITASLTGHASLDLALTGGTLTGALTINPVSNQLVLGGVSAGKKVTISSTAPAADRVYTIPDAGADASFVMTEGSQTINGTKTFGTPIAVGSGGTGQSSYTNGQLLIGNTTGNTLTKATITGTTDQIVVTNGGGSITLSTPQSINTTSSPTFTALTLSSTLTGMTDIYTTAWTDYSGTSSIVGWGSFTTKLIYYKQVGKLVFVRANLTGASNSTTTTFTLPFTQSNDVRLHAPCYTVDNGTVKAGQVRLPANSATVTAAVDLTGTAFGASGTKAVECSFWYQTV